MSQASAPSNRGPKPDQVWVKGNETRVVLMVVHFDDLPLSGRRYRVMWSKRMNPNEKPRHTWQGAWEAWAAGAELVVQATVEPTP